MHKLYEYDYYPYDLVFSWGTSSTNKNRYTYIGINHETIVISTTFDRHVTEAHHDI